MNTDKAWIYYNSPRICPQAPLSVQIIGFTSTRTGSFLYVIYYDWFQSEVSRLYETSLTLHTMFQMMS